MRLLSFDRRRTRRLIILLVLFNLPPLLMLVPGLAIVATLAMLFWINIPGIPLALVGLPFYDLQEFGAIPIGFMGWALIALFWALAAFFLSILGKKSEATEDAASSGGTTGETET